MISSLKKNDHVVTVGGIHGVVTNVNRDGEEVTVTIKVDEATNTKLRITLGADFQGHRRSAGNPCPARGPRRQVNPCPNSQERVLMSSYVDSLWMMAAIVAALILGGRLARKFRVRWAGRLAGVAVVGLAIAAAACVVGRGLPFFGRPAAASRRRSSSPASPPHPVSSLDEEEEGPSATYAQPTGPKVKSGDIRQDFWVQLVVFAAAMGMPFVIARFLTRHWRMPDYYNRFVLVSMAFLLARGDHRAEVAAETGHRPARRGDLRSMRSSRRKPMRRPNKPRFPASKASPAP